MMAGRNENVPSLGSNGGGGAVPVADVELKECSKSSADAEKTESSGLPMDVECEISAELSQKVFENDLLREMILNKVIFSSNGTVSTTDLKTVRLVRKSWLFTAADSLYKRKLPMFHLTVETENSAEEARRRLYGDKLIDKFVRSITSPTRLLDAIPPFSLRLGPGFFRKGNYRKLSAFLASYGEGLVSMDLSFPITPVSFSREIIFHLPQLQRLSVHYSDYAIDDLDDLVFLGLLYSMNPLQIILRKVPDELKELTFSHNPDVVLPSSFSEVPLPQSITKLSFECPMKESELELLIRNELPNLTSLSLFAGTTIRNTGQKIFEILEKLRTTLRSLTFTGDYTANPGRNMTIIRFPVMEKLESLTVTSNCWVFEGDVFQLEDQLPKLMELQIPNTTETMFEKWTGNSVYPEVKILSVSMAVGGKQDLRMPTFSCSMELSKTLTLENMQRINHAFPNLVELELTIFEPMIAGLKYLFNDMRSLEKLRITLKGRSTRAQVRYPPSHWDALLTGLSEDKVKCFQKSRNYPEAMDLDDDSTVASIRNLTALKSLTLKEAFTADRAVLWPLISDVAFYLAFLKMPGLTNLRLHGKFKASQQMAERWRKEKGTEIK